jgi:hypothetical protein
MSEQNTPEPTVEEIKKPLPIDPDADNNEDDAEDIEPEDADVDEEDED